MGVFLTLDKGGFIMGTIKPVVVYGANGYTGRLTCEFLRQFRVPFIAAGRDRTRLEEAMKVVPGIESADYEIAVVDHNVEALSKLFAGAKVICNTVGPFLLFGETVVEAALSAGCHYVDTTGEQGFMLDLRDKFGAEYANRGLLLAPATAYMQAVLEIACRACAEHGDVDTIEAVCSPTGTTTFGSTQTIFQMMRRKEYYLEQGELVPWPPAYGADLSVPFTDRLLFGLPWTGMPIPLWFADHPRVRNAKTLTAFTNRDLMLQVHGIFKHYHSELVNLPEADQIAALQKIASSIQGGMPPRENPLVHRNYDRAIGSGSMGRVAYTVYGHCPYQQTGLLQAFAASMLLKKRPQAVGFQSPSQAFGYKNVLGVLERFGYAKLVKDA
jgi:short subunit dehydrogenase-like uncharacterized protein